MEEYFREGIIALLPVYTADYRAIIVTRREEHCSPRSMQYTLQQLAAYYAVDIFALRKCLKAFFNQRHHLALPLTDKLILIPVKARESQARNETTTALFNLIQVDTVAASPGPGPWLSVVNFQTGYSLYTLNTIKTIQARMRQGEEARDHCRQRRAQGLEHPGLTGSALLAQLPDCDCLLRDIFCKLLSLKKDS